MSEPPHSYDDLFRAVGEHTLTWAYLETIVDIWVSAIWMDWNGKDLGLERPRTSLGRKLDFIRAWYRSSEEWTEFFPELLPLTVERVDRLSDHRNLIIHGLAQDIGDFPETGRATMSAVKHKRGRRLRATLSYSVQDITDLRDDSLRLAVLIGAVVEVFAIDRTSDDKGQDAFSKLLAKFG
jgi:hypothetical protein